jgi:tetratricopeptide (TPR) repeat protein
MAASAEANACIDRALRLDPHAIMTYLYKASNLLQEEDWRGAHRLSEHVIHLEPLFYAGYLMKGYALNGLQHYEQAIQAFDIALQCDPEAAHPDLISAFQGKALALLTLQRREDVFAVLARVVATYTEEAASYACQASVLAGMTLYTEAIQAIEQAITYEPKEVFYYLSLGHILLAHNSYAPALKAFEQAMRVQPENANAHFGKGQALGNLNLVQEALHAFDRSLELDPQNIEVYNWKGLFLSRLGRYEEALLAYEE